MDALVISHKGKQKHAGIATSFEQGQHITVRSAKSARGFL
jgi:hypothetical protein